MDLMSLTLLLVGPDIFSASATELYIPFPFRALLEVEDGGRFRASCNDWVEFCRARDGWARWTRLGAGLLR